MKAAELETPRVEEKAANNVISYIPGRLKNLNERLDDKFDGMDEVGLLQEVYKVYENETGRPYRNRVKSRDVLEDLDAFSTYGVADKEIKRWEEMFEIKMEFADTIAEKIKNYIAMNVPKGSEKAYVSGLKSGVDSFRQEMKLIDKYGVGAEYIGNKMLDVIENYEATL